MATIIRFRAFHDEDAGVWVATSDSDRITAEAATKELLLKRLAAIVPDVVESRSSRPAADLTIIVDWQELRTVEQTTFAIA